MADYTEYEEQGWFSRIKESIKGVLVGGALFLLAFVVLFWNEGRAVHRAQDLEFGSGAVVAASADKVDPLQEGKLVAFSGETKADAPLVDDELGVKADALKLHREVEMYQWVENEKSTTEKKVGGKTVTKKEYSYKLDWVDHPVESAEFKIEKGHRNPGGFPFDSKDLTAAHITIGARELAEPFVNQLSRSEPLSLSSSTMKLPPEYAHATFKDGKVYLEGEEDSPVVGDVRVSYDVVKPALVSVVGAQQGPQLVAFTSPKMSSAINLLEYGQLSPQQMFQAAQDENAMMTWILRIVGLLMMGIGLAMFFKPFAVLADVLPFLGSIAEAGIALMAAAISIPLSLLTISVAWLFYRPLLGVPMLLLAVGGIVGAVMLVKKKRAAKLAARGGAAVAGAPAQNRRAA